jgi:hypothetical protein
VVVEVVELVVVSPTNLVVVEVVELDDVELVLDVELVELLEVLDVELLVGATTTCGSSMWAWPVRFTVLGGPTRATRLLLARPAQGPVATTVSWKNPAPEVGSTWTVTVATGLGGLWASKAPRLSHTMVVGLPLGLFTEMAPPLAGEVTVYFTPGSAVRVSTRCSAVTSQSKGLPTEMV